jgi:Raf kinase inhibitor-like YbhB/YbcL family protein
VRRVSLTTSLVAVIAAAGCLLTASAALAAARTAFTLTSSAFTDNGTIPVAFTCNGAGTQPALAWKGIPSRAKQLALIVEDPDAPIGTFVHWVVAGIEPKPPSIAADAEPTGAVEGTNGAGRTGWIPPCPPSGTHHYVFTLYALDKKVTAPPGVGAAALRSLIKGRVIARARLTGLYGR